MILKSTGREIDTSCPSMDRCWANEGCLYGPCPPTAYDVLRETGRLEHEVGLVPHTDPEVQEACDACP